MASTALLELLASYFGRGALIIGVHNIYSKHLKKILLEQNIKVILNVLDFSSPTWTYKIIDSERNKLFIDKILKSPMYYLHSIINEK